MTMELVTKLPYDHPYRWDGTAVGGVKLWRPDELGADLALWLDAEDTASITLNGSTVSQWDDKSGNGRNVSQGVAADQPEYQTTGFVGKPAVNFNGSTYLFNTTSFMYDNGSISVFTAITPAPTSTTQFFIAEGNSTNSLPIYSPIGSRSITDLNDQSFYHRSDAGSGIGGIANLFDDGLISTPRIVGFTDSGTQAAGYNNGAVGSTQTYTRSTTTVNRFAIGGLLRPSFGLSLPAVAGEIVIVSAVLSTADRQKLEGYLAWKWKLEANLPSGHPYKTTPPTV